MLSYIKESLIRGIIMFPIIIIIIITCIIVFITHKSDSHSMGIDTTSKDNENIENKSISFNTSFEFGRVPIEYNRLDVTNISVTRYHQYKVKGKNPKTNRLKTARIVAKENSSEQIICQKSGFFEPFTVKIDDDSWTEREPSIYQLEYARDLNIIFPSNCSSADVSALISKQLGESSPDYAYPEILDYAADQNICLSPYMSNSDCINSIIHSLNGEHLIAFFVYFIYCLNNNIQIGNMSKLINNKFFYDFINDHPEKTDEYCDLIHNTSISFLTKNKRVDRRNKRMAQLFDNICIYLNYQNVIL